MVNNKYTNSGLRDQRAALECILAGVHLFGLSQLTHLKGFVTTSKFLEEIRIKVGSIF